jgi:hypothetical protein
MPWMLWILPVLLCLPWLYLGAVWFHEEVVCGMRIWWCARKLRRAVASDPEIARVVDEWLKEIDEGRK